MSAGIQADWVAGDYVQIAFSRTGSKNPIIAEWICQADMTNQLVLVSGTANVGLSAVSGFFQIYVNNAASSHTLAGGSAYNKYEIAKISN